MTNDLLYRIDSAVDSLKYGTEQGDSLGDAVLVELVLLWSDLDRARTYAASGVWSLGAEGIVTRIARLTKALGTPVPFSAVPVMCVLNGWYERVHETIGMPTPLTPENWDLVHEVAQRVGYVSGRDF